MAGKRFGFNLSADGWDELKKQFEAAGAAGEAALKKIEAASPQLANAFERAQKQIDETRRKAEALAKENSGFSGLSKQADALEGKFKGAVRTLGDVRGAIELVAGEAPGLGKLVGIVGGVADVFGTLASSLGKHPLLAIGGIALSVAAAFVTLGDDTKALAAETTKYAESLKLVADYGKQAISTSQEFIEAQRAQSFRLVEARTASLRAERAGIVGGQDARRAGLANSVGAEFLGAAGGEGARIKDIDKQIAENERAAVGFLYAEQERKDAADLEQRLRQIKEAGEVEKKTVAEIDAAKEQARQAEIQHWVRKIDEDEREYEAGLKRVAGAQAFIVKLEDEAKLSGQTNEQREIGRAIREAELKLTDELGRKTRDLTDAEKERIAIAVRTKQANEDAAAAQKKADQDRQRALEKYAADIERNTDRVLDNLSRATSDVFFNALEGKTQGFWDTFVSWGKRAFANLAAEAATNAIFRPIVNSVVSSVPGLFGIKMPGGAAPAGGGGFSIPGFGGGGFNINPMSFLNRGGSGGGFNFSNLNPFNWFGGGGSGAAVAGAFPGADAFGVGLGEAWSAAGSAFPGADAFGVGLGEAWSPLAAGGFPGADAFGVGLGSAAGGGASGGALSGIGGAMSAIPVWGWITAAAMLAKSQVAGAPRGSAKGVFDTLLLPSIDQWMADPKRSAANVIDPLGTAFFDVVGRDSPLRFLTVGGIFGGGKKPSVGPNANANLVLSGGQFGVGGSAADNGGDVSQAIQTTQQLAQALNLITSSYGLKASGSGFQLDAGYFQNQLFLGAGGGPGVNTLAQSGDPDALALQAFKTLYGRGNISGGSASIGAVINSSNATTLSGLSSDLDLAKTIDQLLGKTDPLSDALAEISARFDGMISRAKELGLAYGTLEGVRDRELAAAKAQLGGGAGGIVAAPGVGMESVATLRGLVDNLTLGGLSGDVTSEQRYFTAASRFNEARRRAQTEKSAGAIAEFASVAQGVLPIIREFTGTSEIYGAYKRDALATALELGGSGVDPSGAARELIGHSAANVDATNNVAAEIAELRRVIERHQADIGALLRRVA